MNNTNLEHLSNDELRIRLLQYGFQNIPITQTTRNTLIKKLRYYMENADKKLRHGSSLITKFSSDEDSSNENNRSPRKQRNSTSKRQSNDSFPRQKIYGTSSLESNNKSSKNVFISPVFISDPLDDYGARSKRKTYEENSSIYHPKVLPKYAQNHEIDDDEEVNFTNSYTKRLLQHRKNNIQQNIQPAHYEHYRLSTSSSSQPQDENKFGGTFRKFVSSIARNLKGRLDTAKQTFVPMALIAILIIFFAFILIFYMNMSLNIENSLHQSIAYVPCSDSNDLGCIDESNMEVLMKILKVIASQLQQKPLDKNCNKPKVCFNEISHLTHEDDFIENEKNLKSVKYLIEENSFLGIENVDENCFSLISSPRMTFLCTLYAKVHKYFSILGGLAILALTAFGLRKAYTIVKQMREQRQKQIIQVIEEIINFVMEKAMDDAEKFIVVHQMREKLSLQDKNIQISWIWNEALSRLEKNDSRLNFGFENIDGEDVKVIRWILMENDDDNHQQQPHKIISLPNPKKQSMVPDRSKKWMGPAFDKSNKIINPPTNCLKIRQMFEKYEVNNNPYLDSIIQDTILLKVKEKGCKVVDIQLDKKTCCVYVKCATSQDAGIIHEEMNGWWLDQRLIVVKFLREDKFNQRFPSTAFNFNSSTHHFYDNDDDDQSSDVNEIS